MQFNGDSSFNVSNMWGRSSLVFEKADSGRGILEAALGDLENDAVEAGPQLILDGGFGEIGGPAASPRAGLSPSSSSSAFSSSSALSSSSLAGASGIVFHRYPPPAQLAASARPSSSSSSSSSRVKLFLGGLRFEVIQAGRAMVSWVLETACGPRIPPGRVLVHCRSKYSRPGVLPTGCVSVFVAAEHVAAMLRMNQRIFCAADGIYVARTPEILRARIASGGVVEVVRGRVRGPTHPVVVELANSCGGGGGERGAAAAAHADHSQQDLPFLKRSLSTSSSELLSSSSMNSGSFLLGPSPYAALGGGGGGAPTAMNISVLSVASTAASVSTAHTNSNRTTNPISNSGGPNEMFQTPSGALPLSSNTSFPLVVVPGCQTLQPTGGGGGGGGWGMGVGMAAVGGVQLGTAAIEARPLDAVPPPLQRPVAMAESPLSFHVYPGDEAVRESLAAASSNFPTVDSLTAASTGPPPTSSSTSIASSAAVVFVVGLPSSASAEFVSWLFALLGVAAAPASVRKIANAPLMAGGGEVMASSSSSGSCKATGCVLVSLKQAAEVAVVVGFCDRVVVTPRGAWVGKTAANISSLLAEDTSLAGCVPLYIERRIMPSHTRTCATLPGLALPPPLSTPFLYSLPHPQCRAGENGEGGLLQSLPPPPPPPPYGTQGGVAFGGCVCPFLAPAANLQYPSVRTTTTTAPPPSSSTMNP